MIWVQPIFLILALRPMLQLKANLCTQAVWVDSQISPAPISIRNVLLP